MAYENNAAMIDTTVYHGPGASASLVSNSNGPPVATEGLLDPIPLPAPVTMAMRCSSVARWSPDSGWGV